MGIACLGQFILLSEGQSNTGITESYLRLLWGQESHNDYESRTNIEFFQSDTWVGCLCCFKLAIEYCQLQSMQKEI